MAKKTKQKDRGGIIAITACIMAVIIVVAAIITVIAWGSNGFTDWQVSGWFNSWGTEERGPEPEGAYGGIAVTEAEGKNGLRLTSVRSEGTETGGDTGTVTVQAVFTPANTTEREVEWTLDMPGGNAGEYVRMDVDAERASIDLSAIKPFTTPIILECTSKANPEISAAVIVHYLKTPVMFWSEVFVKEVESTKEVFYIDEIDFGPGTIAPDEITGEVTFEINTELYDYLTANGYEGLERIFTLPAKVGVHTFTINRVFQMILKDWDEEFGAYEEFWAIFLAWGKTQNSNDLIPLNVSVNMDYWYDGDCFGNFSDSCDLYLSGLDEFIVPPEGLEIGSGDDVVLGQ